MRLKLSQTGMALIVVMLLFELAFLGSIFWLLQQTEKQAHDYENSTKILVASDGLLQRFGQAVTTLGMYISTHSKSAAKQYDAVAAKLPEQIDELRTLIKNDPVALRKADQLSDLMNRGYSILSEVKGKVDGGEEIDIPVFRRELVPVIKQVVDKLTKFNSAEHELVASDYPKAGDLARQRLKIFIIAMVVLSVILALGAMLLFTRTIVRRVNVVRDNSVRLASNAPLNERLDGVDEIAELDSVFHYAAKLIRETNDALEASEGRVRAIIEHLPVGLIAIDDAGIISSSNSKTEEMFGYDRKELANQHITFLFTEVSEQPGIFMQSMQQSALNRMMQVDARRKNGQLFPAEISLNEFSYLGGRLLLVNLIDATERHELERMKQDFIAMVSHDLKTPLTTVQGTLALFSAGALGPLSDRAQTLVETAEGEIQRLTDLVHDLLDVSQIEAGKMNMTMDTVSLRLVFKRSMAAIGHLAQQNGITVTAKDTDAKVVGDIERLIQVVINLLSNAIKFSQTGGEVTLSATILEQCVEVSVKDNGRGVPPEFHDKIFKRFQQVEISDALNRKGTGLGLPICKAIIEQHGGTIGLESEPGQGSRFWFRLNRAIE